MANQIVRKRTDLRHQLGWDLWVRQHLTGDISGWLLRRRIGSSVRATMSKLPSSSAVLPAELEVLELGLLVALLKYGKHEGILETNDGKYKWRAQVPCKGWTRPEAGEVRVWVH